jgi:hypothetical protein
MESILAGQGRIKGFKSSGPGKFWKFKAEAQRLARDWACRNLQWVGLSIVDVRLAVLMSFTLQWDSGTSLFTEESGEWPRDRHLVNCK